MIVSLKHDADADSVRRALVALGLWVGTLEKNAQGAGSHFVIAKYSAAVALEELAKIEGVLSISTTPSAKPRVEQQGPIADVSGVRIGDGTPVLMCGPCSVESEEQIHAIAERLARLEVKFLRGGAFKPRTSPYEFQGHGEEALRWMRRAADKNGLLVVTEALAENSVGAVSEYAHLVQIGSRNMQNFALLKAVGKAGRPVLLKRAMSATIDEWLLAGEYLLAHGSPSVTFCERGIRGFDGSTRNLLDLGAVALLAHVHRVPVIVDPSHAVGRRDLIGPLSRAALAAGAAGLMIETHDDPGRALSDGPQALDAPQFETLIRSIRGGAQ